LVLLGAFAAHGLDDHLTLAQRATYDTAVFYHAVHTLALLGVLNLTIDSRWLVRSAWCFAIGIVLFSGSLYALAVTGISPLGMITPFGGVAFILGWLLLLPATLTE
jgi:uncharacterized membrane protein YgdD (TMEM256/DUF423 family)|tara:strand:- start:387 stop:704 length:318 start_codon:yes stop_codon:yes gene_type:complete